MLEGGDAGVWAKEHTLRYLRTVPVHKGRRGGRMLTALAVLGGFGLDLLLADPGLDAAPGGLDGQGHHPAGKRCCAASFPTAPRGQRAAGRVLAAVLPLGTFALAAGGVRGGRRVHPACGFGVQLVWCWQALALRGLADESGKVYDQLARGRSARRPQGGQPDRGAGHPAALAEGVAKAAVETVAENFSGRGGGPLVLSADRRRASGSGL